MWVESPLIRALGRFNNEMAGFLVFWRPEPRRGSATWIRVLYAYDMPRQVWAIEV